VSIRVLIVDDEPPARQRIRSLLKGDTEVEIVGECADGESAVTAVLDEQPDLVFLDVQMPLLDGFGVVEAVGPERMPVTVFVTAHDQHALRAFEVNALDYLLKPYDRARFKKAVDRAKALIGRPRHDAERLTELLAAVRGEPKPPDRIAVKAANRVYLVRVEDIDWIEAAGNYLRLHTGKDEHLLRETMTALASRLDSAQFLRIHRSTIVNVERIREIQPWFHGDYAVILQDGRQLTLSRSYRTKVEALFGHSL
jgi:two-component system LytT family response regulator